MWSVLSIYKEVVLGLDKDFAQWNIEKKLLFEQKRDKLIDWKVESLETK